MSSLAMFYYAFFLFVSKLVVKQEHSITNPVSRLYLFHQFYHPIYCLSLFSDLSSPCFFLRSIFCFSLTPLPVLLSSYDYSSWTVCSSYIVFQKTQYLLVFCRAIKILIFYLFNNGKRKGIFLCKYWSCSCFCK